MPLESVLRAPAIEGGPQVRCQDPWVTEPRQLGHVTKSPGGTVTRQCADLPAVETASQMLLRRQARAALADRRHPALPALLFVKPKIRRGRR